MGGTAMTRGAALIPIAVLIAVPLWPTPSC
jgi:hypothetical protein